MYEAKLTSRVWLRLHLAPPPSGSAPCPPSLPPRSSSRPVTQQHLQAAHKSSPSSHCHHLRITRHPHLVHLGHPDSPHTAPPPPRTTTSPAPSTPTHWLWLSLSKHSDLVNWSLQSLRKFFCSELHPPLSLLHPPPTLLLLLHLLLSLPLISSRSTSS